MSGIVGFEDDLSYKHKEFLIKEMANKISHRGPDGFGKYISDNFALGYRRFSSVDLHDGDQPIFNADKSKMIVLDGIIYNHQALRSQLKSIGYSFETQNDAEVILHGYEEYGETGILNKLEGMFAFIIYDKNLNKIFGARDKHGIKPMYYTDKDQPVFSFASEIKALMPHPYFIKTINKSAVKPFLNFAYSALNNDTFFLGVKRLPEGHYFTRINKVTKLFKYSDFEFTESFNNRENHIAELDQAMVHGINEQTVGEIPVGSVIGNLVDANYIAAIKQPKNVYSFGYDVIKKKDHFDFPDKLADMYGMRNHRSIINGWQAIKNYPLMQYHLDEPNADPKIIATFFNSKNVSKNMKSVFSEEGSDILFAGGANYRAIHEKLAFKSARALTKLPVKVQTKIRNLFNDHKITEFEQNSLIEQQDLIFKDNELDNLLSDSYRVGPEANQIFNKFYNKTSKIKDEVKKLQYIDIHHKLAKNVLTRVDRMSMANSVEIRLPYFNSAVVKIAQKTPTEFLINKNSGKQILLEAAGKHLPNYWSDAVVDDYSEPIESWLEKDNVIELIKKQFERDFVAQFFNQTKIIKLIDDLKDRNEQQVKQIWTIYTFLVWYEVYFISEEQPKFSGAF